MLDAKQCADLAVLLRRAAGAVEQLARMVSASQVIEADDDSIGLRDSQLSCRAINVCEGMNLKTIKDVSFVSAEELLEQRNCGFATVQSIREELGRHGLRLMGE